MAPAPNVAWTPPPAAIHQPPDSARAPELPPDLGERIRQLTLADVVDIGLRNNPATRISWAQARASAAAYGSAKGAYFPTIDAAVTGTRLKTSATQGRNAAEQTVLVPSLNLSWLLWDFGGRSGSIKEARETLFAADFSHNAVIQDVVLQIEQAYFQYVANRALRTAQQTTVDEAKASLDAAQERQRVGVATIADVLQARTAYSQALLDLQATEGAVQTTRGALALALGVPATIPYDLDSTAAEVPVARLADSVDVLIQQALKSRPDLAAARATYEAALSRVSQRRADRLPALTANGSLTRTYTSFLPSGANGYTLSVGLQIPLFAGFTRAYDQEEAAELARAAGLRADALSQQVIYQVFSSYYTLQTATRRVQTADDLLASATQSEQVALGRYREGVGTVLDLLQAQSALASARAQRVQARLEWNTALAQLAHDIGILDTRGGAPLRLIPDSTSETPR